MQRLRSVVIQCSAALVLLLVASASRAQDAEPSPECGRAGRPWVALVFSGDGWKKGQTDGITLDLRAGLRLRGIDVCALGASGSEPPLALVQLSSPSPERVSVTIDVHDSITEKRVLRDVDLRRISSDGRGLRVAQASEELLRASWAELALTGATPPATPPPVEVTRAVSDPEKGPPDGMRQLGTRAAIEHYGARATLLGGDVSLTWFFTARVGAEMTFGLRTGLSADAVHGSVDASALVGSLALRLALRPVHERIGVQAKVGTSLSQLRFVGRSDGRAMARERALVASSAYASLVVSAWLSRTVALGVELGPGLPLRAASALDTGRDVMGTSGLELHAALGIGAAF